MAETTTAQAWPASTSRFTCAATLRMRSTSETDVPPNLSTKRDKNPSQEGGSRASPAHTTRGPALWGPAGICGSFILIGAPTCNDFGPLGLTRTGKGRGIVGVPD